MTKRNARSPKELGMEKVAIPAVHTRVQHDDYGTGTVLQADGPWLMIQFDGQACPAVGIHAEDVTAADG